jgi:hypothetical protein
VRSWRSRVFRDARDDAAVHLKRVLDVVLAVLAEARMKRETEQSGCAAGADFAAKVAPQGLGRGRAVFGEGEAEDLPGLVLADEEHARFGGHLAGPARPVEAHLRTVDGHESDRRVELRNL